MSDDQQVTVVELTPEEQGAIAVRDLEPELAAIARFIQWASREYRVEHFEQVSYDGAYGFTQHDWLDVYAAYTGEQALGGAWRMRDVRVEAGMTALDFITKGALDMVRLDHETKASAVDDGMPF